MTVRGKLATAAVAVALLLVVSPASSQRRMFIEPNAQYDGRFTFVRLRYSNAVRGAWSADYPAMERNFMTILDDLSSVNPHTAESNIHDLDDPELWKYPVAYLCEPGYWYPNDSEALALRKWIGKGGFLIIDDFYFNQWNVFERAMRKVLPDGDIVPLQLNNPVFNSFFSIATLDGMHHPSTQAAKAEYYGIYENNDPTQRLLVVINYNNDIGDYMEWSGQGWYSVNLSNDAYKFATNYVIYGLSH